MHTEIHPSFELRYDGSPISDDRLQSLFPDVHTFLEEWRNDDPNIKLKTSGSTGAPKQLSVSKQVMWHSAGATMAALGLQEGINACCALSASYIAGKMMCVRAMRGGWKLHLFDPSSDVLDKISTSFDFAAFVPMQVAGRVDKLNSIDVIILGGAPVDTTLKEQLRSVTTRVYETFGMTELVSHIALKQLTPELHNYFSALPGVSFDVDPENRLQILAREWGHSSIQTNDIVELVDSTHFKWKGRADFVINSGGVKLHPEQIEPVLESVIGRKVYVKPANDDVLGQKLIAVVEGELNDPPTKDELQRNGLSAYECPKEWHTTEAFPLTPTGKIDRRAL